MRRLVIGDIHGCFDELQALLDKAALGRNDEVIALGDLVDRGPDPDRVMCFFRDHRRARSLLGNHEYRHLQIRRGTKRPALSHRATRHQMGDAPWRAACDYMATLPVAIELPEAILVHAFWEPGLPLRRQNPKVLVGTNGARARLESRTRRPWYERYDGDKPLLVGHRDYRRDGKPLVWKDRVFGLDTGCCYGRGLTALLLPEFALLTVPARADHWARTRRQFARGPALSWTEDVAATA